MKQLGLGLTKYVKDFDEKNPPSNDNVVNFASQSTTVKPTYLSSILPYVKAKGVFLGTDAQPDTTLGGTAADSTNYCGDGTVMGVSISKIIDVTDTVHLREYLYSRNEAMLRPKPQ
jgi:hypothetical protein